VVLWSGKAPRTHSQQFMDELTQSYDHLRHAAAHAAGGAAEKVTPRYDRARMMAASRAAMTRDTLAPMYEQLRRGAMNPRPEVVVPKKSRWPMLFGLLAAGAAVGAVGAVVARRRRDAAEWDEFEPLGGVDSGRGMSESKGAGKKLSEGAASVAGSVSAGASKIKDSVQSRRHPDDGTDSMGGATMSERMPDHGNPKQ
jgi:hypothetical protein